MMTIFKLLEVYRRAVEPVLQRVTDDSCPSQSLRARRALDKLREQRKGKALKYAYPILKDIALLKDFLAVHRAVELLERSENNESIPR